MGQGKDAEDKPHISAPFSSIQKGEQDTATSNVMKKIAPSVGDKMWNKYPTFQRKLLMFSVLCFSNGVLPQGLDFSPYLAL